MLRAPLLLLAVSLLAGCLEREQPTVEQVVRPVQAVRTTLDGPRLDALAIQVADGVLDPHGASEELLASVGMAQGAGRAGPLA